VVVLEENDEDTEGTGDVESDGSESEFAGGDFESAWSEARRAAGSGIRSGPFLTALTAAFLLSLRTFWGWLLLG